MSFTNKNWICAILSACIFGSGAAASTMDFASLAGHIDPFTYTDALGTATTGIMTLSLDPFRRSFGVEDATTFSDHLVMDAVFNSGRGQMLAGIITLDLGGALVTPEIATITSGGLAGAGPFDGSTFRGGLKRAHGNDCSQGGWCWTFLVPPNPIPGTMTITLPAGFQGQTAIPLSGFIGVTAVPEPSSMLIGLSAAIIGMVYCWRFRIRCSAFHLNLAQRTE